MAGENIHGKDCRDIYSKKLIILDYLDQKQISKFYNICDFFVFPSLYETGPQVVLEARACGAICFVTRTGGGKRIKKSGEDGIVLKEKNPEIWANEIIKLMRDKNKIKLMKKKLKQLMTTCLGMKYSKVFSLKNGNQFFDMRNILFVIPHPDDEVVGSCLIIKEFLKKKKSINFIFD